VDSIYKHRIFKSDFERLRKLITKPDSELGRECLEILAETENKAAKVRSSLRLRLITMVAFGAIFFAAITAGSIHLSAWLAVVGIFAACFIGSKVFYAWAEARAEARADAMAAAAYEKLRGIRAGEQKTIKIAPGVSMIFCWCPAGDFLMGSPASEEDRDSDENQVKVTLSKGFWMAKTEVTQEQWQAVMGANPCNFNGANLPVESVSWNDAQDFLKKLNAYLGSKDGGTMALPTEAQWEYAARAGQSGTYSGGSLDQVAWYDEKTHPVGTKQANAWGLHDMSGNVCELCADWYDTSLSGGVDPKGPASGSSRVVRGGSWGGIADCCRLASRWDFLPDCTNIYIGFRVARSSVP
jgi:formylglycine-generating enzyme required for sulfatase activity